MAALITCRQVGALSNHPAPNHTEQLISFWQMGVFWDGLKICKEMVFKIICQPVFPVTADTSCKEQAVY